MSCYRFHELFGGGQAMNHVRGQQLPSVGPTLDVLDEAFTSENWIISVLPCFFCVCVIDVGWGIGEDI
ncbi:glycosyltransferase family 66 protein [Jaapia argillacea MUCL 33604]|uniref:Glycosyltransferase family 66 protein n=1 Tax=Jaapia argillacea MUCL 33604 TaxID=933084 RepID=A0A067QE86_9AGAM|nr:glycosyltransferase family 66 protein [Jaapia argillacea MUCL 33604]